ncbi:MAG: flippase-like domain-containing protein [Chloroflexi bacterium]|nr:flippase-like domain-containing protein [Chloroflexota bacterium]
MRIRLGGIYRLIIGLAISGLMGWLVVRGFEWSRVGESFSDVSVPLVLLSVFVFMIAGYLRALRWRLLFVNDEIPVLRLFIVQNEGLGLNNVLPVRIASEAVQLAVLTMRDRIRPSTAIATMGMERVIDVVASTIILTIALFLVPQMSNFKNYVWVAIGLTVLSIAVVRFLAWGSGGLGLFRRVRFLNAFSDSVREMERHKARLLASLAITVGYWLLVGTSAWLIAIAVDLGISPFTATVIIMGTIFFATSVPAAPGAIGTFEFAMVYVLGFFGVAREDSFGFALLTHAVFFLPPTIIAAIFLPREGLELMQRLKGRLAFRGAPMGSAPAAD